MSFWSERRDAILQSLAETAFKSIFSGLVVVFFAQFLIAMVDDRIQLASKRDALNSFRNDQLTSLISRSTESYLAASCARSLRSARADSCRSELSAFLTEMNSIHIELGSLYPEQEFESFSAILALVGVMYANPSEIDQADIEAFSRNFGKALDEMAQNFR